jgi:hypothetical protein
MSCLRFRAVEGILFPDPASPGRFMGRIALIAPVDGWPAGTKKLDIFPVDPAGGSVERKDRLRWLAVWDALRKGIDLLPMEDKSAAKPVKAEK